MLPQCQLNVHINRRRYNRTSSTKYGFRLVCDTWHLYIHVCILSLTEHTLSNDIMKFVNIYVSRILSVDHLCGLVPTYRSRAPGAIPGATRFSEK
jgi:hypothetical protein